VNRGREEIQVTQKKTLRLAGALGASLLLVLIAVPGSALAHERRTVGDGKYDVVVGWQDEPSYAGMMNGATIRIMQAGTTTPVTGAEKTLKLAIRQGASTQAFPLQPVFGQDGLYSAGIVPTRLGDYRFVFSGDINGTAINETFDSADGKFDSVVSAGTIQFPIQIGDPAENASAVQAAQSDAQSARTLAVVGIAVGVIGLIAAVIALFLSTRRQKVEPSRSAAPSPQPAGERA
jgi:hypothetical protein